MKKGDLVTIQEKGINKIDGQILKIKNKYAWVQHGNNGMFIEAFPVEKLTKTNAQGPSINALKPSERPALPPPKRRSPALPPPKRRSPSVRIIQSASKMRLNKIQKWIASQRVYLDLIYNTMKNTLDEWSGKSTKTLSNRLLGAIYAAPETPLNTPGYMYRKIVLYPRKTLNLNFNMASSWSLNPLFAASFKLDTYTSPHWPARHILLRLPLKTPTAKLYIGDTSKLLNSSRKSSHQGPFSQEAEVIVAPMRLREVQRREIPLGVITGINSMGTSIKRLSTEASSIIYGRQNYQYRPGYHASPPRRVSRGMNKQQIMITVIDVELDLPAGRRN
jgi:hypothetical protein